MTHPTCLMVMFDVDEKGEPAWMMTTETVADMHPTQVGWHYERLTLGKFDVHVYWTPDVPDGIAVKGVKHMYEYGMPPFMEGIPL